MPEKTRRKEPFNPQKDNRTIRVFISSTFRDIKAEPDYLVKFTFPRLRKLCGERSGTWGDIDLTLGHNG